MLQLQSVSQISVLPFRMVMASRRSLLGEGTTAKARRTTVDRNPTFPMLPLLLQYLPLLYISISKISVSS